MVLEFESAQTWGIEIKRPSAPTLPKGFYIAATDVSAARKLLVAPADQPFPFLIRAMCLELEPLMVVNLVSDQTGSRVSG